MTVLTNRIICLCAGFVLDMLLGDPYRLPHPVRWIGALITTLERRLRRDEDGAAAKRRRGLLFVLLMLIISGGVAFAALFIAYHIHRTVGIILESILCYQMLSMKCLKDESMKVYRALQAGDTEHARQAVSMIVGRDTQRLDADGITRAAVETVAENTSDGVIAPLFYMALGGAFFGVLYKTINTMDSMVGYKNEKYVDFGRYAAKLDDAANFIPSRIAAVLMIAASLLCKLTSDNLCKLSNVISARNAMRIFKRDRYQHASPNSAQTESVCAGALGVRLVGDAWYFGQKVEKPYIGDDLRPIEAEDIPRANKLLYVTSILMWMACEAALGVITLCLKTL